MDAKMVDPAPGIIDPPPTAIFVTSATPQNTLQARRIISPAKPVAPRNRDVSTDATITDDDMQVDSDGTLTDPDMLDRDTDAQDTVDPDAAFGAMVEPPEPYTSILADVEALDTVSEATEDTSHSRSSLLGAAVRANSGVDTMSISMAVHPTNSGVDKLPSIIDPGPNVPGYSNTTLPLVQSLIQTYILQTFHILLPLSYITTENVLGAYTWMVQPVIAYNFFRERRSCTWTPQEIELFTTSLGKGLHAAWAPRVELPEGFDVEAFYRNVLKPRHELEMEQTGRRLTFRKWYVGLTGEEWYSPARPSVQALQRIPGLQLPAVTEVTKAHKFAQLNELTRQRDGLVVKLWAASRMRLMLKRKLDFYHTGLMDIDIGEVRRQQGLVRRLSGRQIVGSRSRI